MASELLESLGVLLGDLCAAPSSHEQAVLFDVQLARFWRSFSALKRRQEENGLNVAILALAKSGKSTLLNALAGAELLPMNNVPETARICKLVHDVAAVEPFLLEAAAAGSAAGDAHQPSSSAGAASKKDAAVVTARGEAAVRARLQHLNQAARSSSGTLASASSLQRMLHRTLSPSGASAGTPTAALTTVPSLGAPTTQQDGSLGLGLTSTDSSDEAHLAALLAAQAAPAVATGLPADKMLSIHVPIAALLEYEQGGAVHADGTAPPAAAAQDAASAGSRVRLQLLDTPGPNEAGEEGLKHQVARLLDGVDAAVYVLDYTKLKTDDEAGMFERLTHINPALVKRLSQRMFFVVNKVDAAHVSEGQDLQETRAYVADLVTRQMQLEGFRLQPEQALLTSARNALLSRLVLRGKAGQEATQRFVQLAFGRFANPAMVPQDQLHAAAHALLEDSGLLELESQVLAYLHTHAASVKHLALVDDVGRLLAEVRNVTAVCEAALTVSAGQLASHVGQVRAQLAQTLAQFEAVTRNADTIGEEVSREVRAHLQTLRGRLYAAITTALDTEGGGGGAAAGAQQAAAHQHLFSRGWHRVRERFLSMFTSPVALPARSNIVAAGGGAAQDQQQQQEAELLRAFAQATGPAARSRSKEELASLLLTLHEELTAQIHAEVREFWGVMEAVAAARHAELLSTLNAHLAQLSQQVEAAVQQGLPVRLQPVDLSLQPPDASQFHADLDQLLSRGLVETREKHLRVSQREVVERVRRHGICRWGDYWESVPRVRTVVEAYTTQVYELVPQEITQQFIRMVDGAIETTQASLESYVSQFVHHQLAEAREQLRGYGDNYLSVMSGALETSTRDSEHQSAALTQVKSFLERLNAMTTDYESLRRSMEGAMPRAHQELDLITFDEEDDDQDEQQQQQQQEEGHQEEPVGGEALTSASTSHLTPPLPDPVGTTAPAVAGATGGSDASVATTAGSSVAVVVAAPGASSASSSSQPAAVRDAAAAQAPAEPAPRAEGPFDYGLAMSSAMSSSHLQAGSGEQAGEEARAAQEDAEAERSADEWDLVEAA